MSSKLRVRNLVRRHHAALVVALLLVLQLGAVLVVAKPAKAGIDTSATPSALAQALLHQTGFSSATFVSKPPGGQPVAVSDVALAGFPRKGPTYAILTTGDARLADDPNSAPNSGVDAGGGNVRGDSDFDVTILRIDLDVPQGKNCLSVDFRFLTEEFPEFVGDPFNDAFIAELDVSDWTTSGSTISAPHNFAFDAAGSVISVNTATMNAENAAGTTYDGATALLRAQTPITPGAHSVFFSIFDQADHVLDSAVFLDQLFVGVNNEGTCQEGAAPIVDLPGAPQNLAATAGPGVGEVSLSWQAPASGGGSAITNYKVYRGEASGALSLLTTLGNVLSFTDTALPNGATRFYAVSAVNGEGEGPKSNEASATTFDVPSAPLNLVASAGPGAGEISLSWQAPASDGGAAVTNYNVYRGEASGGETFLVQVGNVLSHVDSGVPDGATRFYRVRAVNLAGEGALSNEASATALDVPSAPQNLVASTGPGAGQITLDWQPPADDGGSAITGYVVYRRTPDGAFAVHTNLGAVTTFVDDGLGAGQTFVYQVAATNAAGEGLPSNEATGTTFDVPGAPQALSAEAGPGLGQISLVWTAPATTGGLPITGYNVYRDGAPAATGLTDLSFVDSGLGNGALHTYTVTAVNDAGEGPASLPDSARTFASPSAPTNVNSASGPDFHQITITWQAPADDGGLPVTNYRIYRGEASGAEVFLTEVGPVLTFTDDGLPNGTTRFYQVTAVNGAGEGPRSAETASAAFTAPPPTLPTGRQDLGKGRAGNSIFLFGGRSITPDAGGEGGPEGQDETVTFLNEILEYDAETNELVKLGTVLPDDRCCMASESTPDGTTFLFGGMLADGTFSDEVLKFDPETGTLSNEGGLLPDDRCCLAAEFSTATGLIYLFGGQNPDGSPVGEVLTFDPLTGVTNNLGSILPDDRCCLAAESTPDGLIYLFGGQSPSSPSGFSNEVWVFDPGTTTFNNLGGLLPDDRCCLVAEYDGDQIVLFGGLSSGGQTHGDVLLFDPQTNTMNNPGGILPDDRCCLAGEFVGGDKGFFLFGGSSGVESLDSILQFSLAAPHSLTAGAGPDVGQITLAWQPPVETGGETILGYRIYRGEASGTETFLAEVGDVLTFTDDGLPDGATRFYKVSAFTGTGEGPQSNEASATTFAPPGPPQQPDAQAGPGAGEITLAWLPPLDDGGTPVTGFNVYGGPPGGPLELVAEGLAALAFTEAGLGEGETREYVVTARNAAGEGDASESALGVAFRRPEAPQNLEAETGIGETRLGWDEPESDGGTPVTNHRVYRAVDGGPERQVAEIGPEREYVDTNCPLLKECTYRVSAVNLVGEGPKSNEASALGTSLGPPTQSPILP